MKRFILALVALFTLTANASAMSFEQAREQALFLTDKMAYELNLTDEQYEAAYEINLDYLMRIDSYDDLYGVYWRQRNLDLSYILLDWQYRAYCDASYFYRPLYWSGGYWHFGVYARYPYRDYFFFGCPNFVFTYHGGHSWYHNGGRSWYHGRPWQGPRHGGPDPGMRAHFDNGRYGQGYRYESGHRTWTGGPQNRNMGPGNNGNRNFGNRGNGNVGNRSTGSRSFGNLNEGSSQSRNRSFGSRNSGNRSFGTPSTNGTRSFGTPRESSTRTTVGNPSTGNRSFGNRFGSTSSTPRSTFTPQGNGSRSFGSRSTSGSSTPTTRSFGTSRQSAPSSPSRSFGGNSSFGTRSTGSGFGGSRSSSGSFGGGHSGAPTSGGGHFGRR